MQGNLLVDGVFGGVDSQQLKGPEIVAELKYLLNLLTLCWHFSKKPFPLFLEETGFSEENVLLQEPKAGVSYFFFKTQIVLLLLIFHHCCLHEQVLLFSRLLNSNANLQSNAVSIH